MENLDFNNMWLTIGLPWATKVIFALLIFVIGRWVIQLVLKVVRKLFEKSKMDLMLSNFILSIANALLLLFVVIAVLSQLGVDTTSMIALIGAAGLAVGLALQNSLQNFAAGVMLIIFKPFKVDDFVEAGGVTGVVEAVGIFTSTLRTGDNKEIIVPNGGIYGGNIVNYSARATRRVDMTFGVSYEDDIRVVKAVLEKLCAEDERILKDPEPVVALSSLGDSSVNFIVRPWVNSADYWPVLWDMNAKVKLAFEEAGLSIPYPQMDVFVHKKEV